MVEPIRPQWLGRLSYHWAWRLQHLRREAVIGGTAPEACWLLEHDPVITTGRRGVADLPTQEHLAARGVALHRTERGGLATWHGPGQLVGYLVIDLARHRLTVRTMVEGIEQGIIDWLETRGVEATRRAGYPGIWVGRDKICALGLHFRRGISMHGFALNLEPDLQGFKLITPCGIEDGGITSLRMVAGVSPHPREAATDVGWAVIRALGIRR